MVLTSLLPFHDSKYWCNLGQLTTVKMSSLDFCGSILLLIFIQQYNYELFELG